MDRLERIENKLDDVHQEIMQVKLGYQEHERRSLANEKAVEILSEQFKPLHELLLQVRLFHRIIMVVGGAIGFIISIVELLSRLK